MRGLRERGKVRKRMGGEGDLLHIARRSVLTPDARERDGARSRIGTEVPRAAGLRTRVQRATMRRSPVNRSSLPPLAMRLRSRSFATFAILLVASVPAALRAQQTTKKKTLEGKSNPPAPANASVDSGAIVLPTALKARSIGPAVMGGRVSSIGRASCRERVYHPV